MPFPFALRDLAVAAIAALAIAAAAIQIGG
jgi:hypothetical protein